MPETPRSHLDRTDWNAPEVHEFVREIAAITRKADERHEVEGGGTRHWVRDHFLPELEAAGFEIVRKPPPRRVTTPYDDPIVQACVDHGGHFWPEQHEDQAGPPTCTRCWFYRKTLDYRKDKLAVKTADGVLAIAPRLRSMIGQVRDRRVAA